MERTWLDWELRRRWRSLLGLALLVALVVAVVAAAIAGADRAQSSLRRLLDRTLPATVNVLPNIPGFDWAAVRELPGVEAISVYWVVLGYIVDGDLTGGRSWFTADNPEQIERPVVFAGREPDYARADEVLITQRYADLSGKGVGDTVTLEMWMPESFMGAMFETMATGLAPDRDGPVVEATITGIGRSFWMAMADNQYAAYYPDSAVFVTPGFIDTYFDHVIGTGDTLAMAYANAFVRLSDGEAGIPDFVERFTALTGLSDVDMWLFHQQHAAVQSSLDFEAWALRALALAAAVASLFLVGQAVVRAASGSAAELSALVGAGITARQRVVAALLPVLLAVTAGALLGVLAATLASPLFPLGTGAFYEPAPGIDFDGAVLLPVALAALALATLLGAFAGWSTVSLRPSLRRRPSPVASAATNAGLPVPVTTGTRFALERGVGDQAIPVTPTLVAIVAGVIGLVGTMTFNAGLQDATANPSRWGETWDLVTPAYDPGPLAEIVEIHRRTPGVEHAGATLNGIAQSGSQTVALFSFDPDMATRLVVTRGRLPTAPNEILLGPTTLRALGVSVGDTIPLLGSSGAFDARITGTGLMPSSPHSDYDHAGWIPISGYRGLFGQSMKAAVVLTWAEPGTDLEQLIAVLTERLQAVQTGPSPLAPFSDPPPGKVSALARVGLLPQVLGLFLIVLAVGAVAHALVMAISRRLKDLAVLRALGQTPGQTGLVAVVQAMVVGVVGLLFGIPLGLALGRTVWRLVANQTPVAYVEPLDLLILLLAIPATLLVQLLLAAQPARRAARLQVANVLRSE